MCPVGLLLAVALAAMVAVPRAVTFCSVVFGAAVPTGGPNAVGVSGIFTTLIGHSIHLPQRYSKSKAIENASRPSLRVNMHYSK